jgi:hypothetical protein
MLAAPYRVREFSRGLLMPHALSTACFKNGLFQARVPLSLRRGRVGFDAGCPDIFNSRSGPCLAHPDSNHGSCSIATAPGPRTRPVLARWGGGPEIVPSLALNILTLKASTTWPAHPLLRAQKNKTALSAKSLSRAKPREWGALFFVRYTKGGPPAILIGFRNRSVQRPLFSLNY